jgi:hypothetical protein
VQSLIVATFVSKLSHQFLKFFPQGGGDLNETYDEEEEEEGEEELDDEEDDDDPVRLT